MDVEKQVAIIFAASKGHLDDLVVDQVADFESGLFEYLEANTPDALAAIVNEGVISDETAKVLEKAVVDYKGEFNEQLLQEVISNKFTDWNIDETKKYYDLRK